MLHTLCTLWFVPNFCSIDKKLWVCWFQVVIQFYLGILFPSFCTLWIMSGIAVLFCTVEGVELVFWGYLLYSSSLELILVAWGVTFIWGSCTCLVPGGRAGLLRDSCHVFLHLSLYLWPKGCYILAHFCHKHLVCG